jgi:hypothetical protein
MTNAMQIRKSQMNYLMDARMYRDDLKSVLIRVMGMLKSAAKSFSGKLDGASEHNFETLIGKLIGKCMKAIAHPIETIKLIESLTKAAAGKVIPEIKLFFATVLKMIMDSYKKDQRIKKAAEKAAKAAAEAAKKAGETAVEAATKKDSMKMIMMCHDCAYIVNQMLRVRKALIAIKHNDDRRRIGTTKKPTAWEIRYVLGINPNININMNDFKAYRENGFVVVEDKRKGTTYRKPFNEVMAAAEAERQGRLNNVNPDLIGVGGSPASYNAAYMSSQDRNKVEKGIKNIDAILKALLATIGTLAAIKAATSGWGAGLRDFIANLYMTITKGKKVREELKAAAKAAKAAA